MANSNDRWSGYLTKWAIGHALPDKASIINLLKTSSSLLPAAILFILFFAGLAWVQFSTPDMPDNDGYYHIKIAAIMREQGLTPEFPWLPLTILNEREYYDHHFLFHVALIPFTMGDLRLGAKFASVLFAALAFLSVWWLFRSQRLPYASLWALGLLAVSEAFLYRMSITRAQSLSLAVLALATHWLLTGKHHRLLLLGFLYVWLYNAFPLIVILAALYTLSLLLVERKLDVRPLLYTTLGVALGLFINPYFPHNLVFIAHHLLPKLTDATAVSVGNEWFPYTTTQLLTNSPFALLAFLAGIFALGWNDKRLQTRTLFSLFSAALFGVMLFQSRRFIEYFPAFALIFSAFAISPLLEAKWPRQLSIQIQGVQSRSRELALSISERVASWIPALILLLVFIPGSILTLRAAANSIQGSKSYTLYAAASTWLEANTPPGARIFQTDWDDFPRLFYYNTHNTYLIGLDPTYMQIYDPQLYDLWVDITQGKVENPSQFISTTFGSKYILTDLLHQDFIRQAEQDSGLMEMFRDNSSIIYQVID